MSFALPLAFLLLPLPLLIRLLPPMAARGGLRVPAHTAVVLSPHEHTDFVWLPYLEAAERCFSPSNAEAILLLPQFVNAHEHA